MIYPQLRVLRILMLIFLTAMPALAQESELVFGPEWTFTSPAVLVGVTTDQSKDIRNLIRSAIDHFCKSSGKCRTDNHTYGLNYVTYEEAQMIANINEDPGVYEVQATPASLKKWIDHKSLFQNTIFAGMKAAGQVPHEIEGAGHLNIGLQYFQDKPLLLRNFIIDFYNRPGLGVVLYDLQFAKEYAPYLHDMDPKVRDSFVKGLAELDRIAQPDFLDVLYYLGGPLHRKKEVALAIRNGRFGWWVGDPNISLKEFKEKFVPLKGLRLEIRTLRPQADMDEYIMAMEIFESRIKSLELESKKAPTRIPLKKTEAIKDGWVALGEFADYLEESGLNWKNYRKFIPKVWRDLPEENFVRSPKTPSLAPVCAKGHRKI
jgi:hypothetical protein